MTADPRTAASGFPTDAAPNGTDDAIAWAQHLLALPATERPRAIDQLRASGAPRALTAIMSELFAEPTFGPAGASVSDLLNQAEALRYARDRAKELVAALHDIIEPWPAWIQWAAIPDRDELRLRLGVLARCTRWSEELTDFITFFFRASVSDLYQEAAIALGRHLHRSQRLRNYLRDYARSRSVPLNQPVRMNGQRSRRRLLIALSAARGTNVPELNLAPEPLPLPPDHEVPLSTVKADLSIMLLAAELALIYSDGHASVNPAIDHLLSGVLQYDPSRITRSIASEYGRLLVRRQHEHTDELWWAFFTRQRDLLRSDELTFAQRAAVLRPNR